MSIEDAITSYNQLMRNVFSEPKMTLTGVTGAFKTSVLEKELTNIVRKVTGNTEERMIAQDPESARCKV
jgi:hypothetical protein